MAEREVGIRELRNHTSRVLDALRSGDVVFLTTRGTRVAEIRPVGQARPIESLIAKAKVISSGDTGAFEVLMAAKQDDIDAHAAEDGRPWG